VRAECRVTTRRSRCCRLALSGSELSLRPFRVFEATRVSGALDVTD